MRNAQAHCRQGAGPDNARNQQNHDNGRRRDARAGRVVNQVHEIVPTGGVEVRFLVHAGDRAHGQTGGVAVLLNPADRVHVVGVIEGLRERLRTEYHVLGCVQGQETTQHRTDNRPGEGHSVTRPVLGSLAGGVGYGGGPAATRQVHHTRGGSHHHGSDRHKRNQAPRNAGLTQHNRGDSHQGKSQ